MSARQHTFRVIDERLQEVGHRVLALAAVVEHQYHMLARALAEREDGALERVVREDTRVDQGELEIDGLVVAFLSTLSPVASDLRRMLATTKAARELERAGDEARNAARRLGELADTNRHAILDGPLAVVACLVAEQMDRACVALVNLDPTVAQEAIRADREVNAKVRALRETSCQLDADIRVILPYVALGHSLERGGDHAKVIAKLALGAATGVDVRHRRIRKETSRLRSVSKARCVIFAR